jgi:hypothetical protein
MNKVIFNWEFTYEHIKYNLYSNSNIVVFVDNIPSENIEKKDNKWVYIQVESTLISGSQIQYLLKDDSRFDLIFTFDPNLLHKNKSIKFLPNNKVYWTSPTNDLKINLNLPENLPIEYNISNKKFQISMLCGGKNWCPGHQLRRKYWENQKRILIPKKFIYSQNYEDLSIFDGNVKASYKKDKTELFIDSMFHIAIENNRAENYFTEKLIDCIVSKTLPIYYGCPNIHEYFNINGMIIINDLNDIDKINDLTEKYYYDHLIYIEENYQKMLNLLSFKDQFINIINNKFNDNVIEKL